MGKREGTMDKKKFKVSPEMVDLRITQQQLNRYLWTAEISQLYTVESLDSRYPEGTELIEDTLNYLKATAFYKNNQGHLKYRGTVKETTTQITENMPYLYRSVLTYFASAFENYLVQRIRPLLKKKPRGWGPYYKSLDLPELWENNYPVPIDTIISADFCRLIRNSLVHPPFELPKDKKSKMVIEAKKRFTSELKDTGWWEEGTEVVVNSAVGQLIGGVTNHVKQSPEQPPELFFALFNFTTLDKLAFQIEEALMDSEATEEFWVHRKSGAVRRKELSVD